MSLFKKILYPSPRVSQLDAYILDNELFSLLKQQLSDVFALHSTKPWSYNQNPEMWSLGLNLLIFRLTTLKSGSSYGLKLQNLKLTNSRTGKIIGSRARYLLLAVIIGDFLYKKFESYLYSVDEQVRQSRQTLIDKLKAFFIKHKSQILGRINDAVKVLNLVNFVLFLVQGRFPTLMHRVLGISLTPVVADLLKFNGDNVNFEFQNRQLVWNVMTEFLVFTLPLLQLRKWGRIFSKLVPYNRGKNAQPLVTDSPVPTKYSNLPRSQCAICIEFAQASGIKAASTYVTNACITNCGHIFCYVCLAVRFNAMENGSEEAEGCPRCRMKLTSFRLYGSESVDVDEDAIVVPYEENEEDQLDEEVEQVKEAGSDDHHLHENDDIESNDDETSLNELSDYSDNEDLAEEVDDFEDVDDDLDDAMFQ